MARRWWAAAAFGLAGCSRPAVVIQLPPPSVEGAVSMVIAYESGSAAGFAISRVVASSPEAAFEQTLDPPGDGRIVALYFDQSLRLLRIPAGVLAQVKDTEPGAFKLPPVRAAFALELSRGRPGDWTRTATQPLDPSLEAFRFVADPQICTKFHTDPVTIDEARRPLAFLTPIPAIEGALIGSEDGTVFKVDGDAQVTALESGRTGTVGMTSNTAISAAVVLEDGQIWFGDASGALYSGRFDALPMAERVVQAADNPIDAIDVTRGSEPFEAFLLTRHGALLHVDELFHVFQIYDFTLGRGGENNERGAVVRTGPGQAFAVHGTPEVVEVKGLDKPPVVSFLAVEGLTTVAVLPGFGTLTASKRGRLTHRLSEVDWLDVVAADSWAPMKAITAYRDGYVFGGDSGYLGEFSERNSFCAPRIVGLGGAAIEGIVRLKNDALFLGATKDAKDGILPSVIRPIAE